jgi:hypothetical protein
MCRTTREARSWMYLRNSYGRLIDLAATAPGIKDMLIPSTVLQDKHRILEVKRHCPERTEDVRSNHSVRLPEFEVTDHHGAAEGAVLFLEV